MKKIILLAVLVLAGMNLYAQENKAALGIGLEWNMNSRKDFGGGAAFGFDYTLPRSLALGLNFCASYNFTNAVVFEVADMIRWYFMGKGHTGFFLQADLGAFLMLEDGELSPYFLGGLRGGYRLPLGSSFYLEPYGRIGYPFIFGIGVMTGYKFK
ncbi:hypothetical protein [Treponema sp. R80B11-R83G3]